MGMASRLAKSRRRRRSEVAEDIEQLLSGLQPELRVTSVGPDGIEIKGRLNLYASGEAFDAFDVRIDVNAEMPELMPVVYETGGRIPRHVDRHIIDKDGQCCITIWQHWYALTEERSFRAYLTGPIYQFFLNQAWFEQTETWRNGEWDHGIPGLVNAYCSLLEILPDRDRLTAFLGVLATEHEIDRLPCPCGSGLTVSFCHSMDVERMKERVNPALARTMLMQLADPIDYTVGSATDTALPLLRKHGLWH